MEGIWKAMSKIGQELKKAETTDTRTVKISSTKKDHQEDEAGMFINKPEFERGEHEKVCHLLFHRFGTVRYRWPVRQAFMS